MNKRGNKLEIEMVNSSCQLSGYILCLISGLMTIIGIGIPYWSRDTQSNQVIESYGYSYGLWWKCLFTSTGI